MTISFFFAVVFSCLLGATLGFFLGVRLVGRRWGAFFDTLHHCYVEDLKTVLNTPVYLRPEQGEGDDDICPDCGEYHDDEEPGDPEIN